jgi:S1-C subfamily serine protease
MLAPVCSIACPLTGPTAFESLQNVLLEDTFEIVSSSIVAFISRGAVRPAGAARPLFPPVFGTGFFVHPDGIVATNRHVIDVFSQVPGRVNGFETT